MKAVLSASIDPELAVQVKKRVEALNGSSATKATFSVSSYVAWLIEEDLKQAGPALTKRVPGRKRRKY